MGVRSDFCSEREDYEKDVILNGTSEEKEAMQNTRAQRAKEEYEYEQAMLKESVLHNAIIQHQIYHSPTPPWSYTSEFKNNILSVRCNLDQDAYFIESDFYTIRHKIGCITARQVIDSDNNSYILFENLFVQDVDLNCRNRGIGTVLIERLWNEAKAIWPKEEFVVNCNSFSRPMFERIGFNYQSTYHILTSNFNHDPFND